MNKDTKENNNDKCCAICENCCRMGHFLICRDRNWLLQILMGVQRVPSYGFCNHFKRLQHQRTK